MIEVSFRSLNHNPTIVSNAGPDVWNQVYSRHRIWLSEKGKNDPKQTFAELRTDVRHADEADFRSKSMNVR